MTLGGYSFLVAPLVALAVVGLLLLALRWSSRKGSLVARPARPGAPDSYGMLVEAAAPKDPAAAERARATLAAAGIRCTVARTIDGPRLMVFPADFDAARRLIGGQ